VRDFLIEMTKKQPANTAGVTNPVQKVSSGNVQGSEHQKPKRHKESSKKIDDKGLTRMGIHRVAKRAAVGKISKGVYGESREHLDRFLHNVLHAAAVFVQGRRGKVVTQADIANALSGFEMKVV